MDLDTLGLVALAVYGLFWLAIGAAIGSFLNVVIYRLPRGLSLAHPPSSCPACRHRIRWRDNVPVFGWLLLGGRCRDCRYPIAPRYPLVEAAVAVIFLSLVGVELLSGGRNLPFRAPEPAGLLYLGRASVELLLLTLLHCLLFTVLLAVALIDRDGLLPPLGLVLFPVVAFGVVWYFCPRIHPGQVPLGLVVGILAGVALASLYDPARLRATTAGLGLIGLVLGWVAVVVATGAALAVFAVVLLAAGRDAFRARLSPLAPAGLAAFGFVLAWKPLVTRLGLS